MNTAEEIYHNAQDLPEIYALETLHFLEFLKLKSQTLMNQGGSNELITPQNDGKDLRELLKNYPVGNRTSIEVDKQINVSRDEWN